MLLYALLALLYSMVPAVLVLVGGGCGPLQRRILAADPVENTCELLGCWLLQNCELHFDTIDMAGATPR